ncbi:FAD-binding oxidoreductase [Aspergillus alliaceus]|uniref:FAD-binding oxidoreductase n=1 Tax=Petromyces alliaceus TaxID=209559 RepID=UPI0012A76D78|nr:FAD-binding domain-containing protein [Aspergillus alliaceus]KAB8235183.1 FAD-binding domain-containing protein [Aspergillus alliaceus]
MVILSRFVSSGFGLFQPLVAALIQSQYTFAKGLTAVQAQRELGPLLSSTTSIFGPVDSRWFNVTERYQCYAPPQIQLVVQPGRESDISTIVQYANNNSVDFLVVNRGHALTSTIGEFTGIQIDVRSLKDIVIQPDGKAARLQAGTYNHELIKTLWEHGYVATSGTCSCVGMVGPALGGGHGLFQGRYGLISDNIVSLNVVLGNGTATTVNATHNSDLWWAMLGAGHNFGIVTSFDLKIYPAEKRAWYYREYVFTGDHLETLFKELNKFHNNGTMAQTVAGSFGVIPDTESMWAVIIWTFVYDCSQADAEPSLAPFDLLGAISHKDGDVMYPEVPDVLGSGLTSDLCAANKTHIIATAGLQVYNITAQRQIYDLFNEKVVGHAELRTARVVHEGYAVEGVRRIEADQSAYPLRQDNLLMYFDVALKANSELEAFAREWAKETRDLWNAGQPWRRPTTYVNYAFGDESVESMYGYEPWRLGKLRALKAQYDPENRLSYYNPIIPRA